MLVNIKFNQKKVNELIKKAEKNNPEINFSRFYQLEGNLYEKIKDGIYLVGLDFNFIINLFSNSKIKDNMYSFSPKPKEDAIIYDWDSCRENYGVCDNYEQILAKYPELENSDKKFALSLCSMKKSEQPSKDGWRWHKWGEYIGIQQPQCEYLYDEENINEVFIYHIYEIE